MAGGRGTRTSAARRLGVLLALTALWLVAATAANAALNLEGIQDGALPNYDARTGSIAPTAAQLDAVDALGADATWNSFGTPHVLTKDGGFLATGVQGDTAVAAARAFLDANKALFKLSSADALVLHGDSLLAGSQGHAVTFRQRFGSLDAWPDGIVTVGLTGSPAAGWSVASVSSTLTGADALTGAPQLSLQQGWSAAASTVGLNVSVVEIGSQLGVQGGYGVFNVSNFGEQQYARPLAFVTPSGVVPAIEALVLGGPEPAKGQVSNAGSYSVIVDARDGSLLMRTDLVDNLDASSAQQFDGDLGTADGGCGPFHDVAVPAGTKSLDVVATADLPANDIVLTLVTGGKVVGSSDTATSPEAIHYAPAGGPAAGTYQVHVCDYRDGAGATGVTTYHGSVVVNDVASASATPYPPLWRAFPREAPDATLDAYPWNVPSTDTRALWCWEKTWNGGTIDNCNEELKNPAARAPWDYDPKTNEPTFTTRGNNANDSEAWNDPLAPGPFGYQPFAADRNYSFPYANSWFTSNCNPATLVPGQGADIGAAVANLFAMHNRMHDWSYGLGFTEENWNQQSSNYGNLAPPPAGLPTQPGGENDPVLGQSQAGALNGGSPNFLGRDNANMRPLPDGISSITNMYLWQPLAGAFYGPCVDGDYDLPVIGHEYGHAIENRMIGKGWVRTGDHAGAMGEANGDLNGMEVVNEYNYLPAAGTDRYAVGTYATGNTTRGIRNVAMDWPYSGAVPTPGVTPRINTLNFSDIGYDVTGPEVHADGEPWVSVNFALRQALVDKYNASFPYGNTALQLRCAQDTLPADQCPGNRRWIQLVYDAYLLMPIGPSMLEARDAYLAADLMRSSDPTLSWPSNQTELWREFARYGYGQKAYSSNAFSAGDQDPIPDFSSPRASNAKVTFRALAPEDGNTPVPARIFVGWNEARVSPVADTDPVTPIAAPPAGASDNLDDTALFVPGTYELVADAPGYGHLRFRLTLSPGQVKTVTLSFASNWASKDRGATAGGDGTNFTNLIDDTESTDWERTGSTDVRGTQVTVDLAGSQPRTVNRVQVSALVGPGQNRFSALRQFAIQTCTAGAVNAGCTLPTGFTTVYTSPANAFPGTTPRPVETEMLLRSFDIPATTATHIRLVVLTNQCTGNAAYQGEQDSDPANDTDCRLGSAPYGQSTPSLPAAGAVALGRAPQIGNVRIAELQVFGRQSTVK